MNLVVVPVQDGSSGVGGIGMDCIWCKSSNVNLTSPQQDGVVKEAVQALTVDNNGAVGVVQEEMVLMLLLVPGNLVVLV